MVREISAYICPIKHVKCFKELQCKHSIWMRRSMQTTLHRFVLKERAKIFT